MCEEVRPFKSFLNVGKDKCVATTTTTTTTTSPAPTGSGAEPTGMMQPDDPTQSPDRARARRSDAARQPLGVARGRTSAYGSPAMLSSMFGCVLVAAGVALITARDWHRQRKDDQAEAQFIAGLHKAYPHL